MVVCGATVTACGSQTVLDDAGTDGSADAHADVHDVDASQTFDHDAQADAYDAFDPPDTASDVVNIIKPPPPIH